MTETPVRMYGVLDCAADPALYDHVARLEPDGAACLFEGRLHPELRRVSPHVVELAPQDPLSKAWRATGWGRSWGLLIASRAGLPAVRRRLRHFTQARLPDGTGPVLFRFWDPRVFRVYLPLVEAGEIGQWFKDIDRYIVEDDSGEGSLRFELAGGRLQVDKGARPDR
jgi:hypothetical protein